MAQSSSIKLKIGSLSDEKLFDFDQSETSDLLMVNTVDQHLIVKPILVDILKSKFDFDCDQSETETIFYYHD